MLQAMSILANIIFPRRRVTQTTIVLVTVLTVFVVEGHSLPYPPHPHPAASLPVSPHKNKDNNNAAFPPALRRPDAETNTHTDDGDGRQQHHQPQSVVSDLTAFSQHRLQHQTPHHHQHLHQRQARLKSTQSRTKRTSGLGAIKLMGLDNIDFTASTLDKALNADAAQRQTGEGGGGGGRGARTRERTPPSLSPSPASPSSSSPASGRRKLHSSVRLKDLRKMLQQMSEAG